MSQFEKREQAYETEFSKDEAFRFKVAARRDKLLAQWLGECVKFSDADIEAYISALIKLDVTEVGDEIVFKKLRDDFKKFDVEISDREIKQEMAEKLMLARTQLKEEYGKILG